MQIRHGASQEIGGIEHADMLGVDGNGLVEVEAGRIGLHVAHIEFGDHLVHREHITVRRDGPAKQRQIVEQALANEAIVAVIEQVGFRVALGKLLVALAHHIRHVAEQRHLLGDAQLHQIAVEDDLTRCGAQQILAAQHHIDIHHGVIHRIGQRVQRIAIRAHDHIIRHGTGLELDGAADQVIEGDVLIGHAQTQRGLASLRAERGLLLLGQHAVIAVIPEGLRPSCGDVARLDLLWGGEGLIGIAGLQQLRGDVLVDGASLGLAVGAVRPAHVNAFVPVDAQPAQGFKDLVVAFLRIARGIGVLDTEQQGAARGTRLGPVEQGRADHAHMRGTGGRRAETHAHVLRQRGLAVLGFVVFHSVVSISHGHHCAARTGRAHRL